MFYIGANYFIHWARHSEFLDFFLVLKDICNVTEMFLTY